jgi:orotidine-5'-phosphate decarboxylase
MWRVSDAVENAMLSDNRERLILALDVPDIASAKALVEKLGDSVVFYKIGLELAMSGRYFELMAWLLDRGKRVFADLKFYDIPATVGAAVRQLSGSGASFLTVHAEPSVVEAAAANRGPDLNILAVTVLTSLSAEDIRRSGIAMDVPSLVTHRAMQAIASGADGVIASGHEAALLRARLGAGPWIVTPGIRPDEKASKDDQKRVVTARQAFTDGASHIVVGRPIRAAQSPYAAAMALQAEIANIFG